MLINSLDNNQFTTPLEILDALPIKFYLTGSRFFNSFRKHPQIIQDHTDYDYFCEYSESNVKTVMESFPNAKFVPAKKSDMYTYNDKNIVGIAFIQTTSHKIDVQFVKSVPLKIKVQKILAAMGDVFINCSKLNQQQLWDAQYLRICKERNIEL